jgi:homoserine kinase
MTAKHNSTIEVRVPASTANLGPGFDCFGLALDLHLVVRATLLPPESAASSRVRSRGEPGSSTLPQSAEANLIFHAMRLAAQRQGGALPPMRLAVHNAIPLASGLGSSAAAIVAGIVLGFAACGKKEFTAEDVEPALTYATEIEGHADNVGAALMGGLAITLMRGDGSVAYVRKNWPKEIRAVAVTPNFTLATSKARAALPASVTRVDAVSNLQRTAMLVAALDAQRHDLIWDALQDRLHQPYRQNLIPGLAEILQLPRMPGLLGVALSGAGPTAVAFATEGFEDIGKAMTACFQRRGLNATTRTLSIAEQGATISQPRRRRR